MIQPPFEVVILNDYASPTGGSTSVALASALGLAERNIPVTFFSCIGPVSPELARAPNIDVVCLDQPDIARNPDRFQAAMQGLINRPAALALRQLLARKSPATTVVHVHTWTKALSPYALAAAAEMGFPLVVTLHDYFITCPSGGFFVHRSGEICQRTPLSLSCLSCNCDRRNYGHKLWRSARTALQNRILRIPRKVARYIAVSDFSLEILRPHLPPNARARVIRNPIECEFENPAAVASNAEFLFLGRFEAEKGPLLLAQAARESNLPAVFIGDGALRTAIGRICPHARFTGWLHPSAVRRELRKARALVFPPMWQETLGMVVIEAAAAGVPAIVSDRCAARDLIRDGSTGLHFNRGSADSLGRKMRLLASDGGLASRLGRAAHEWYWRDPWTLDRHVEDLLTTYGAILGSNTRAVPAGITV